MEEIRKILLEEKEKIGVEIKSKQLNLSDIEIFEYDFPELISVVTFEHPHRGQGITVLMSIQGIHFQISSLDDLQVVKIN